MNLSRRGKAGLVGALMGGLVGPALGALLYGVTLFLYESLLWPHSWSRWRRFGEVAVLAAYAILMFGVPGMCVGGLAGVWLSQQRTGAKRHIRLRASLAGLLLGYLAAVIPMLLTHAAPWGLFFYGPLAAAAGVITANLFVWILERFQFSP